MLQLWNQDTKFPGIGQKVYGIQITGHIMVQLLKKKKVKEEARPLDFGLGCTVKTRRYF